MKPKTVSIQLSESRMKRLQRFAKENGLSVSAFLKKVMDTKMFDEFLEDSSDRQIAERRRNERGNGRTLAQMKRKYLGRKKKLTELQKQLVKDYKSIRYTQEDIDFLNAPSFYLDDPKTKKKSKSKKSRNKTTK